MASALGDWGFNQILMWKGTKTGSLPWKRRRDKLVKREKQVSPGEKH